MGPVSKYAVLLSCAVLVAASSFPDHTSCDAEDPRLGYIRQTGNQTGRDMWWTAAPVRTDAYTLRTGDTCGSDPTSYVPGQYMSIHLRTHKYKGQFRGLLLYAVAQATGQRVGDWVFSWPNSNMFWKPQGQCQNKSLMHLDGAEKYYHHEFTFQTPPIGTGAIEFHCLIKRGEANTGEFYWPNLNGNLIISEGSATGGNRWVEGTNGQSCSAACSAKGLTCDSALHNNAFTAGALLQRDSRLTTMCNSPALESNDQIIYKDPSGWCYYPSQQAGVATSACTMAVPNGTTPICSCGSAGQPSAAIFAPLDTACLNGYVAMGSASHVSSSLVSIALMLFTTFWFFQPRKTSAALFLAVFLGCAQCVQAHNWVIGVSRSFNQASTYKPCRPRVNDQPHWQINEGMKFNAEWATGHDWYFYFTIVNSRDLEKLNDVSEDDLDDYIAHCQPSQDYMRGKSGPVDQWRKQHISGTVNSMTTDLNDAGEAIYTKNISLGDPLYYVRPPQFPRMGNEVRWVYTNPNTDNDRRCNYFNSTYPFLIAVHRFVQVQTPMSRAGDRDIAQFTIDLSEHRLHGYGQGSYVMQYLWRGYYDCIDVDVFDSTTTIDAQQIGGVALDASDPKWSKVDHCQFEEVQGVLTNCMEIVTDASTVLTQCANDNQGNCQGVNVVPLWLPGDVYPLFSNRVGIPWYDPANMGMFQGGCDQKQFAVLGKNTMIGYGVSPRLPNNTHASYSVTDDPEDPLFYATCFIKKPEWKFLKSVTAGNTTIEYVPPPWAYSSRCVDCETWQAAQDTGTNAVIPRWNPMPHERQCRNCQSLPPTPTGAAALTIVSRGQKCDGSWGGSTAWYYGAPNAQCANVRCVKSLILVGTPGGAMTAEQCVAKAKLDPECSEHVQHNTAQGTTCECWTNSNPTCCGQCKPIDWNFPNWRWNVYSTAKPTGDPTCANGIASADGRNCCPKSCGVCPSKPTFSVSFQSRVYQAPIGWAVDDGSRYGLKNNTYPQAYNTYGWTCDRSDMAEDRDATSQNAKNNNGTNYHSTVIKTDNTASCSGAAVWNLLIGANGTSVNLEVHTLYTKPFTSIQGCQLNGAPNYDPGHNRLGQNDMAWVVRGVTVTSGTITWSGAQNQNCGAIAALRIFPSSTGASVPAVDCQTLTGQCCPHFLDMGSRPCSTHQPPCSM